MSNEFDEVLTKLNPKDRESLAKEIGLEVEKALARAETAREAAADPETIRQANLNKMYGSHDSPVKPAQTIRERTHEAMAAWKKGERWPSNSIYASMDFEAMDRAREAAREAASAASLDPATEWDREQKAKGDS
jgi:hypothetical protein